MNNIFTPDKSNFLLKGYHISSKLLIPIFITSLMTYKSENDNYKIRYVYDFLFGRLLHSLGVSKFRKWLWSHCVGMAEGISSE